MTSSVDPSDSISPLAPCAPPVSSNIDLTPNLHPPAMNNNDTVSISRAASTRSRSSKRGSTISRSQSLVKRQIQGGNDLKPSDVLIERFVAWKTIVKQLIAYFEVRTTLLLVRTAVLMRER